MTRYLRINFCFCIDLTRKHHTILGQFGPTNRPQPLRPPELQHCVTLRWRLLIRLQIPNFRGFIPIFDSLSYLLNLVPPSVEVEVDMTRREGTSLALGYQKWFCVIDLSLGQCSYGGQVI